MRVEVFWFDQSAAIVLHGQDREVAVQAGAERYFDPFGSAVADTILNRLADHTVQLDRTNPDFEALRTAAPHGYDVVVEATGVPALLEASPALTRSGGTVLVYGMADADDRVPFSPYEIFSRQLTVMGSFAQTHCFDRALRALRSGRVRTEGIVTDSFDLEHFGDALSAVRSSASVKAVVRPGAV